MSPDQKKAAIERLAKAREARKKDPSELKSIHHTVAALPADHVISYESCKKYLKAVKEQLSAARKAVRAQAKGAEANYYSWKGYESNINNYLRNGDWSDLYYGEDRDKKMGWKVTIMAYYDNGKPKRTVGFWYPDISGKWTQEMEDLELEEFNMTPKEIPEPVKSKKRKGKTVKNKPK